MENTALATLLSISLNRDFSLAFVFSPIAVGILIALVLITLVVRWYFGRGPSMEIDTAELGIGSHKISFKPNIRDQEIAYKIWVELSTRKIGLPIDLDNDVISEIYDSWYNFFSVTRELIKDIPVSKVKNKSTSTIIDLSINVLNEGLRPHLTLWQARFRHFYDSQIKSTGDFDPQSIQAKFPKFEELKTDLMDVNGRLIKYRDKMRQLVLGLPVENKLEPKSSLSGELG